MTCSLLALHEIRLVRFWLYLPFEGARFEVIRLSARLPSACPSALYGETGNTYISRRHRGQPQPNIWHAPMPLICSSFEPGHLDGAIEAMPDSDYRTIALAEAAYFRGKADEACRLAEPFLTSSILPLRISSCFICGFANLSLDHAHAARACLLNLASSEEHLNDEYGDQERAAYLLFTASSSVLLH